MLVKLEYAERKKEINAFLNNIKEVEARVSSDRRLKRLEHFNKMSKAHFFVMLYNLIEATTRDCLTEIFDDINSKGLLPKDLNLAVRKEWIRHFHKREKLEQRNVDLQYEKITSLMNSVIDDSGLGSINIQLVMRANIDDKEIRKICTRFGITLRRNRDDSALYMIRHNRNQLAHGVEQFSDLGGRYSISELVSYKRKSFNMMTRFINAVERYIGSESFKI